MNDHVYVVFRQSNMTEGRGHMQIHSVWRDKATAELFIDQQPDIMGRRDKWSMRKNGDWKIESYKIYKNKAEYLNYQDDVIRERAMAKLTEEEKRVLFANKHIHRIG